MSIVLSWPSSSNTAIRFVAVLGLSKNQRAI
jgi:hypothetical protein